MGEGDYNLQINSLAVTPDANLVYFNATYSPSSLEIKSRYHRAIKSFIGTQLYLFAALNIIILASATIVQKLLPRPISVPLI